MDLCFILVSPAVEGNVGASARALKTMGFSQLRLVNPCNHRSQTARMMAHGAQDLLESAEVYADLPAALADRDLSIATSAKAKDARVEYHHVDNLRELIRGKGKASGRVGLVFGGEESGLSNEEIRQCDLASSIPMARSYPSLNLSQAVMVYAFSLRELAPGHPQAEDTTSDDQNKHPGGKSGPDPAEYRVMMESATALLRSLELDRNPALFHRILERLSLLGEDDIHLMLSVLSRLKT